MINAISTGLITFLVVLGSAAVIGIIAFLIYLSLKPKLKEDDVLMITADHGCDPSTPSTDHSREYVPILVYGAKIKPVNLGIRDTYADIAKTIEEMFNVYSDKIEGTSFLKEILK